MDSFIDEVVSHLIQEGEIVQELVYVVPSRRAGIMLRSTLSRKLKKTIFAPEIYSIEEFIAHISGLKSIDQTDQLFTLYEVYREHTKPEAQENFATFYGWAQTVLYDFNEIDRYLIDQHKFFNYLNAVQEMNHWSTSENQTDIIKRYLTFWETLPVLYRSFCSKLQKRNQGHQGLVYRKAAEDIEHYIESLQSTKHIFIGFNALNTAEQHIIQALLSSGNATVFWDAEAWFMDNSKHEASLFLRGYRKEWKYYQKHPFHKISTHYQSPKNIKVTAVAQNIEQAKMIGDILAKYSDEALKSTAVVLNDESLLLPVLNALPENVETVNITMGIPLRNTPVATFFDQLFKLHTTFSERGFYFKEVLALLQNSTLRKSLGSSVQQIIDRIIRENSVYLTEKVLKRTINEHTENASVVALFAPWEDDPKMAIGSCLKFIEQTKSVILAQKSKDTLTFEYFFGFFKVFNQLKTLNDQYAYIDDLATLKRFYIDVIGVHTLDLRGDPYEGVQIMGMLESRLLDFENVIMASVNEGMLPAGKSTNSYIPHDLKKAYNLPTFREKDAVYAYHFYRLLHRAQNIDLIYTTVAQGLGSQEKSRFLLQLEIEGPHELKQQIATPSFVMQPSTAKEIKKTPEIVARIRQIAARGFSPSSLTTYIRNPIDFYYKYVLKIKETEAVEETIAANTMGTIVHNTLEELYKPYVYVLLSTEISDAMLSKVESQVQKEFEKEYGLAQVQQGKNLIIYKVVCRYVENYLQKERVRIEKGDKIIVQSLEADLNIQFQKDIHLRGKVDLVEIRNDVLRIIDYKTGSVEPKHVSPNNWEDLLDPSGSYEKAFQVLMYAYMMHKTAPLSFPIKAGIISFKNLQAGFLAFKMEKRTQIDEETLSAFAKTLEQLISEILNPDIAFAEPKNVI